jgi:2-oxo-hept-3-ene-1,7-dioate hydratase
MLTKETITSLAEELAEAERTHGVIPRITARFPEATVEDSYAIQAVWKEKNLAAGRRLVGRKIGLTSRAMQASTGITEPDVMRATEYVTPALEVLNSHIEIEGRTIVDTISDNAAYGGLVLGGNPTRPDAVDLRWVSALLYRNETIEETGVAAAVLNHPATGVAWLANKTHRHGDRLEADEIILAGSFTRPVWIEKGDTVLADYGPMGTISCRFV